MDRWSWSLCGHGNYSVKSAREYIDQQVLISSSTPTRWSKLIPIKLNIFMWRLALDKLPTRNNLAKRGIIAPCSLCPICRMDIESRDHLFFRCPMAFDLIRLFSRWWSLQIPSLLDYTAWEAWIAGLRLKKLQKLVLEASFSSLWWHIWVFRNAYLFSDKKPLKGLIFDNFVSQTYDWVSNSYVSVCTDCPEHVQEELRSYQLQREIARAEMEMNAGQYVDCDDEVVELEPAKVSKRSKFPPRKKAKQKGPVDVFFSPNPEVAVRKEVGDENVVQIITDNASAYVKAGSMIEATRKHIYWTPCATHCLDLMLEDNGKKIPKDAKGKRMQAYFLKESFRKNIVYTLKLTGPLVNVLRMVDGERKPAMGYVYKAMDKAKDAIQNSFPNREDLYEKTIGIIDHREDLYEKTIEIIVVEFMSYVFGVKR
ncbi:RNA-directed DNA polymerase, eukaryota, reverse transcriptase zinc-binding domain protein [Tanacetum coccineum]|uniref:RNA-directed DNA polymerase, eukaryota, reverse transcriptase zinc-binding domain protein n=1 Tax=Tanacetum coccineum TaxID=301880 RepID=A0ABQ5GCK0_9ASTR